MPYKGIVCASFDRRAPWSSSSADKGKGRRRRGVGGHPWPMQGTMCAKAGRRNMLPPESQAKEEDVYSIQCLCGPSCRRGVRDIWARPCNTRLSARVPAPNATLLPLHVKAQWECSLLQEALASSSRCSESQITV